MMYKKNILKKFKVKQSGITIIALIVTIIILLILSGIMITMLSGENGIIKHTITAKENFEKANELESLRLKVLGSLDDSGDLSIEKLKEALKENKIEYNQNNELPIRVSMKNSKYIITKGGQVIEDVEDYNKKDLMVCLDATHNTYNGYDKSTTIWYDLSGNENNAILSDFEYNDVSGWKNGSLKVRGNTSEKIMSKESIKIPFGLKENESFSVEMVFEDNDQIRTTYLSSDNGWHTFKFHDYYNSAGIFDGEFYIGGNIYNNPSNSYNNRFEPKDTGYLLKSNRIYYIAYTYEANTNKATLYINGTKNSYTKNYIGNNEACNYFIIQALDEDGTESGSATYHQIRIYNRALCSEEIEKNFSIDSLKYKIYDN